ncbi:hypothetical protein NpPPO83_00001418 [Neofusicoccum parvum]|uniref:Uncharacterized protein n=1 Tax=Neofusicoccum parvum TaxID=310453 RepID=A0ACB5S814_9PEZI|nr:hypothetical protein NpPPO83_00001418 [Neofusicoccum parvum]
MMFCLVEASTHLGAWCTLGALLWQVGLIVVPPLWGLVWVWWDRKKLAEEAEKRRLEAMAKEAAAEEERRLEAVAKEAAEVQRVEREKAMVVALEDIQRTARYLLSTATKQARVTGTIVDRLNSIIRLEEQRETAERLRVLINDLPFPPRP